MDFFWLMLVCIYEGLIEDGRKIDRLQDHWFLKDGLGAPKHHRLPCTDTGNRGRSEASACLRLVEMLLPRNDQLLLCTLFLGSPINKYHIDGAAK